jgi:multicomponent Na+:H+ antiporter subunit F
MSPFFLGIVLLLLLLTLAPLVRLVRGPTLFDRALGAALLGTHTLLLLIAIGFLYRRVEMFVDMALAYAMLGFIGTLALAKYLEGRREGAR